LPVEDADCRCLEDDREVSFSGVSLTIEGCARSTRSVLHDGLSTGLLPSPLKPKNVAMSSLRVVRGLVILFRLTHR
jgi:hypothetical protein